jgi:hypothetical protein
VPDRNASLATALQRLDSALQSLSGHLAPPLQPAIAKWRADAAALQFHLRSDGASGGAPITVLLGGTGTGKSTITNRLIGATVSAASFRRTFTAGPVALVGDPSQLPSGWLGVEHVLVDPAALPARGQAGALVVVSLSAPGKEPAAQPLDPAHGAIAQSLHFPLIDTPDLDGDQPAHPQQADAAFRWCQRIVFVVTPEKYQMTELLPYYRLARRYEVAALFAMNKCEEPAVLEDFRRQLAERDWPNAAVFVVARDDAAYQPPAEMDLPSLRRALASPAPPDPAAASRGMTNRLADSLGRLADQILSPLHAARKQVDALSAALSAMEAPAAGVDVNPITVALQRRLQQRSVLYLIGPQRVLDRVRQVPTLLARLPRATWEWVMRGQMPADLIDPRTGASSNEPPNFNALLSDQFTVVRSRIDDVLRSDPQAASWIAADATGYQNAMIEPTKAGEIADSEIADLRTWLESRWNATPRDTRMLQAFLKYLPGGQKLTKWTEAAPYLLTIIMVAHHALFGHIDLMVLGGYSLATWLTEKLSNEVSGRTRRTNRRIGERFESLAHEQIAQVQAWLNRQAASPAELAVLERLAGELAAAAG